MGPLRPRPRIARAAARGVLRDFGVTQLPVAVEEIAWARTGAAVMEYSGFQQETYGALSRRGNELMIVVSSACPNLGHRRFTVAHEIGHLVIEGHAEELLGCSESLIVSPPAWDRRRPPIESEADIFAAELLLPSALVQPLVDSSRPGLKAIKRLRQHAEVSLTAAAIAYTNNSSEPVAVILTKDRTIQWVAPSEAFLEEVDINVWGARDAWAPRGSAAAELAKHPNRIAAAEEADSTGLVCEWFDDGPDLEVEEECVGLGSFGRCLSFLTLRV